MEQKTAEEMITDAFKNFKLSKKSFKEMAIEVAEAYAKQQQEIAVEKALEIASEKASNSDGISFGILDLKDEVLLKLNK